MKAITLFLAIALLLAGLAGNAEAQRKRSEGRDEAEPAGEGRASDIGAWSVARKGPEAASG